MLTMQLSAQNLRAIVSTIAPRLQAISDEAASQRPLPGKWSKKEILGHLIDSACNNHQKFVRTMAQTELHFVGYQQNFWVDAQQYNQADWGSLIALWQAYNQHLAHLMERAKPETLHNTIHIEGVGPFALAFVMEDYTEHLKHHLKQILPEIDMDSKFQNVYNA
jgi:hypothetical protein